MTGNKELLSCIDSSISSDITLGNDFLVKIEGKGTVPILTKQKVKKDIHNVYHVPDLTHNLLSVGQLIEHGYKVLFEGASCRILLIGKFDLPSTGRIDLEWGCLNNPSRLV